MKTMKSLGSALAVVAMALASSHAAPTAVDAKTVNVAASIAGVNTLSLAVKNMDGTAAIDIGFSNVNPAGSTWAAKGSQYAQLSVNDNALGWELRVYTDNFNFAGGILPSTSVWGFQYGGLKGPEVNGVGQRAGTGWMILPDAGLAQFGGPDAGDPSNSGTNGWTFLKDRSDLDPTTPGGPASFDGSGGYKNVAFGSVFETRIVRPNILGGNETLGARTDPFYCFLGGDFRGLAPGAYAATITFELLNL